MIIAGTGSYYGTITEIPYKPGKLTIGNYTSIANNLVVMYGGRHRTNFVSTYPFDALVFKKEQLPPGKIDIDIGSDVWIGFGVTLMSGVTIGDGAIIGALSVVRRDVEPYSIIVGNPSVCVGKRFSDDIIKQLLEIRWWNWPNSIVETYAPLLFSSNIERFLKTVKDEHLR